MRDRRRLHAAALQRHSTVFGRLTTLLLKSRFGLTVVGALLLSLLPVTAEAAPGDFGAIAYSPSTKVASFGAGGSQSSAQNAAVASCKSQGGGNACKAYLWFENGYGALASSGDSFGTGWGTNAQDANRYAIQICQQEGGTNCAVVYTARTSDTPSESPSARGGVASGSQRSQPPSEKLPNKSNDWCTLSLDQPLGFDFRIPCDNHDQCIGRGCDEKFYQALSVVCYKQFDELRPTCSAVAREYYKAVVDCKRRAICVEFVRWQDAMKKTFGF